jgi:predicted regulator of Ras-like GTPase activity (Roadblock/LC7/MglB family)
MGTTKVTHFNKVCGVNGLYVGADGAEVDVASSAGALYHGGTLLSATAAEINSVADSSARMVAAGGTLAMSQTTHDGKIICLDTAAGSIVTLPASTGGGAVYRFLVTVTATSNSHIIKVANATDEFRGFVYQDADTATAPNCWWAADNDDTITLNRSTTGLAAQGEYFEIVDAVLNHYFVRGYSQASGTEATPFSNTVS